MVALFAEIARVMDNHPPPRSRPGNLLRGLVELFWNCTDSIMPIHQRNVAEKHANLLQLIQDNPGITFDGLSEKLGFNHDEVSEICRELAAENLVYRIADGETVHCHLSPGTANILQEINAINSIQDDDEKQT